MTRRFTRHSFNRAHWLRARRGGVAMAEPVPADLVAIDVGGCAPPVLIAGPVPAPFVAAPRPKLNLRDAPSSMESLAESWKAKHGG